MWATCMRLTAVSMPAADLKPLSLIDAKNTQQRQENEPGSSSYHPKGSRKLPDQGPLFLRLPRRMIDDTHAQERKQ